MDFLDERVRHGNSAIVLAAVKVFLNLTAEKPAVRRQVAERIKGPLMTLVTGASPEVASVLLAHVLVLARECEGVFDDEVGALFVRYSDPPYVQALKIRALSAVATERTCAAVVEELSSLVSAFDDTLSARAVQALGELALRLPAASAPAADKLVAHLRRGVPAVTREAALVARDLLRRYRTLAPRLLPSLTAAVRAGDADSGEAKAALVWVLGEFGGEGPASVPEAPYLLEPMIDEWAEEPDPRVRSELLTAAMKLFFARAGEMQGMLGRLLKAATADAADVDVHDRALLYYRLLAADPVEARAVVAGAGTAVEAFDQEGGEELRAQQLAGFGSLALVYGLPEDRWLSPEVLAARTKARPAQPVPRARTPACARCPADNCGAAGAERAARGQITDPHAGDPCGAPAAPAAPAASGHGDLIELGAAPDGAPAQRDAAPTDFGGGGGGAAVPSLQLDAHATMTPTQFQELWVILSQADALVLPLARPLAPVELEAALATHHVCPAPAAPRASRRERPARARRERGGGEQVRVMAQGPDGAQGHKFFLYGVKAGDALLCEAALDNAAPALALAFRSLVPEDSAELALLFRAVVAQF